VRAEQRTAGPSFGTPICALNEDSGFALLAKSHGPRWEYGLFDFDGAISMMSGLRPAVYLLTEQRHAFTQVDGLRRSRSVLSCL
jgi:hypothetical protein